MSTVEDEKKPASAAAAKFVNLKVVAQDGSKMSFRIKRSTPIKNLLNAYCERKAIDFSTIVFLIEERCFRSEMTPDELQLEDGDEISAMLHQDGGAAA